MPVTAPELKASSRPAGQRLGRGLRGAHIGAHRDVHADEAGGARQHRADQEADGDQPAEREAEDDEDHDADDGDGGVLAVEIGLRAFVDGGGDFLHARVAGVGAAAPNGSPRCRRRSRARHSRRSPTKCSWWFQPRLKWRMQERTLPPAPGASRMAACKGASPRPGKRADIAKKAAPRQRRKSMPIWHVFSRPGDDSDRLRRACARRARPAWRRPAKMVGKITSLIVAQPKYSSSWPEENEPPPCRRRSGSR